MTTTPALGRAAVADLLEAVVRSQYPRQALPTIAANRGLTLAELQQVLAGHGYPDKARMRQWRSRLLQQDDAQRDGLSPDDHRAVDTVVSAEPRRAPYVAALPVADLFVDYAYQRELDDNRVARMVKAYDPALVGIIEVSRRDDESYAILDGQHRWAAEKDHSFDLTDSPHIACRVHTGLSLADEAKLYHQLNTTRRTLTGWDRWLARRASGDAEVLAIDACAAECGYTIQMRGGDNVLRATKACENIVALGGTGLLTEALTTIRAAYGGDQTALDGAILGGVAFVLDSYTREELELARLVEALAGIVPRQLVARAVALREVHKGTSDRLTAHVIVERYNATKGRRVEAFLDRVKPQTKTPTAKVKAETAYREAALAWGAENGFERSTGKDARVTAALRTAYDAHLAEQGAEPSRAEPRDAFDDVIVQRALAGDRGVSMTRADRLEVVRRAHAAGMADTEIADLTGMSDKTAFRIRNELGLAPAPNQHTNDRFLQETR